MTQSIAHSEALGSEARRGGRNEQGRDGLAQIRVTIRLTTDHLADHHAISFQQGLRSIDDVTSYVTMSLSDRWLGRTVTYSGVYVTT